MLGKTIVNHNLMDILATLCLMLMINDNEKNETLLQMHNHYQTNGV
jgi:hypothetical protein